MNTETAILLSVAIGDDESECTLADFVVVNEGDAESIEAARALAVGQSVRLGGGAAPIVTIWRLR